MKKKSVSIILRSSLLCLLVVAVLVSFVGAPASQVAGYEASYIKQLTDVPALDLQDYLDSSVMFQLPDHVKDDQEISVIITVDTVNLMDAYEATDKTMSFQDYALNSEEAAEIKAQIAAEKAQILSVLDEKEVAYTCGDDYSTILSGFEIEILAGDFDTIRGCLAKGQGVIVSEEYAKCETQLVENEVNVYDTGIFDSSNSAYDGSGMVVAVLDTGLDSNHTAFSPDNFTSEKLGLTYADVSAALSQTVASTMNPGLTVDDVYINEKVPFGYDYADNDPDVYSTHNSHGTHVSGVIAGKDDTITGVAPNAQIVSMKIFSDIMDTARASWILSALEDCVVLGVDVINMSIGTSAGFSRESDEEVLNGVYDKIRESGISCVVAASNSYSSAYGSEKNGNLPLTSNPDVGTVGSPGTYLGVMSVASISGEETPYLLHGDKIIYFTESTTGSAQEKDFVEDLLGDQDSVEMEYVIIPGVGRSADYTGLDVEGKIVLVRRGSNTFEEKSMIAESKGAAGIIVYNNVSGDIKMNVGDAKLAVCSISQDDGEALVAAGNGKLTIKKSQTSGPFISDFSSWGPTPSLNIKPEITAHGGNILSAITGGGYDRMSGTSMACPNLAGVTVLLRQYVVENLSSIADDNVKVTELVNKLIMSTADIALNTNGLPYAVRKQGAGLADLYAALETPAYITTYDKNGDAMDKTKLELGDDPNKTGVYEMSFTIHNFSSSAVSYDLGAYVLTEGVSDTLTNAGETTVTEEAYALAGKLEIVSVSGGTQSGSNITVNGGSDAKITVKITLTDEDKAYLDKSFANGMYVEGYITLNATSGTDVDMSIPYLAFYGDWTVAPLFDLEYFETHADELDDSIAVEDKTMADAYATRPIGGVSDDFVSYLGTYYFLQDPSDMVISANKDYVALSNQEGTIHSLRFVWAGLLRNAERIEISITDDTTGEVVFETVDYDVRKSYGDGGTPYPANVEIEFDTMDYNLANNSEYTVRLVGYVDYNEGGIETNERNVFEFPLTVDFQAPTVTDVQYYYKYDKTLEKNRLYAKVGIYDNHYAMSAQLGYVAAEADSDGNVNTVMKAFEQYMTPVYSNCNSTTYVEFELTDYIYEIKENATNKNSFVVSCYDYALNYATFEIGLPDNYVDFYFDGLEEGITLSPNQVYSLEPLTYPASEWGELLEFTSSKPSVARVVNNKIVACSSGTATIRVRDPETGNSLTFKVTVLSEVDENYKRLDKPVADNFTVTGYDTLKAYYQVASEDKLIGDTGATRFFEGKYNLSMYPSESVSLNYDLDAYFPNDTTVQFVSSNDNIVSISQSGVITAKAEGYASVTVRVLLDGKTTYYSQSISIEVMDPFVTNGAFLTHYFGNGGTVTIPEDLSLTEISSFAFSNFDYVLKTEEELAFDDAETSKQWFIGESTITKVIIPEGVEKINAYAFANLTALEEVVLPSTLESIEYGAFYGCTSLKTITFSSDNNLKIINQNAFQDCDLRGVLDLSSACIISPYAFAGNAKLEGFTTSESLLSIGQYAFAGCKKLSDVTIGSDKVKYGAYAFTDCESLTSFYVNGAVLPEGMFYQCDSLTSVTIGPDVNDIGPYAFRETKVSTFEIKDGNKAFKVQTAGYILSADGTALIAVAPTVSGEITAEQLGGAEITTIGKGAFSHNTLVTAVSLPNVTAVKGYAFSSIISLRSVELGHLTEIGDYAFYETEISELPAFDNDTKLGIYAFAKTSVTSVTVPDGMILPEGIFSDCMKLKTIVIGDSVTIGEYAFSVDKNNAFSIKNFNKDGEKYFYYEFASALTSLTIGNDAVISDNAFSFHASLEEVTLGENATIGYMAFYNNSSLKRIDLSKALSIGEYAFSGDVYSLCLDDGMSIAAIDDDMYYLYTYHAPQLTEVELLSATSIGAHAFSYCRDLKTVALNDSITEIPDYCFSGCIALESINLGKVTSIGNNAFESVPNDSSALTTVDLSSVESIGTYAFVYNANLVNVTLNPAGTDILEGAFAYCSGLTALENLEFAQVIDPYAFAYTGIVEADLSGAVSIGDFAFLKEEVTAFTVKLGNSLTTLGDNPFAMCILEPFSAVTVETVNGVDRESVSYTFDLSESVRVIDGSLYADTVNGMELIVYAGINGKDMTVAEGTVRIGAYAFACSDVENMTLPYTVGSVGHKAFYGCDSLKIVIFTSYESPIFEEEFDASYYDSFENIPGIGEYGYYDYYGNSLTVEGDGFVPYYMWTANAGLYSNVFYGANFVDYVGYVPNKLVMVRPSNGVGYETYVQNFYFNVVIDGAAGADDTTLEAIALINKIPATVTLEDEDLVLAARAAYNKVVTKEQQALVTNYNVLDAAEKRLIKLKETGEEDTDKDDTTAPVEEPKKLNLTWLAWVVIGVGVAGVAAAVVLNLKKEGKLNFPAKKKAQKEVPAQDPEVSEESEQTEE